MAMNLNKTISWMPPQNSNVDHFRGEFDRIYENFTELNDVEPRLETVEGVTLLSQQTLEAGLTNNTPVYFDADANLWKRYKTNISSNFPALFIGAGLVALNGAVVNLTFTGDVLYISREGELVSALPVSQMTNRESLGYRMGEDRFKLDFKQHRDRLPTQRLRVGGMAYASAYFGAAVDISGERVIGGGTGYDSGYTDTGYYIIYRFNGQDFWTETGNTANDKKTSQRFGTGVSLDGTTALIGAYEDSSNGNQSGAAYIFAIDSDGNWPQQQKLTPSTPQQGARFGLSSGLEGDVAVIGAYMEDSIAGDSGAAYVFRYDGSIWNEEIRLVPTDLGASDLFGARVAISGDVIAVGAGPQDVGGNTDVGAVYVYRYDGTIWQQEAKLAPPTITEDMYFGVDVAVFEDRIVLGAYHEDTTGGNWAGTAYIYKFDGTSWNFEARLTASDGKANDQFGISVDIDGESVVVGAWQVGVGAETNVGAAYVYKYNGAQWVEKEKLYSGNLRSSDYFGVSVAIEGDMVVVGSSKDDSYATDGGAAYVFNIADH